MPVFALRRAATLVEILIAVTVLAVLTGLLVPTVQKVRAAATRAQGLNQLRQIGLATHALADSRAKQDLNLEYVHGLYTHLLSYLGGETLYAEIDRHPGLAYSFKLYCSPADPSLHIRSNVMDDDGPAPYFLRRCIYPTNARAFTRYSCYGVEPPDGAANTIAYAEYYSLCDQVQFDFQLPYNVVPAWRRASFADTGRVLSAVFPGTLDDVVPVTGGVPPATWPSVPGKTFQVRPRPDECDPRVPQPPHPGGLLVCLFDGSARGVAPGVSEVAFWSAVTPAGGEVAPLD